MCRVSPLRALATVFAFAVACALPTAAAGFSSGGLTYSTSGASATVTGCVSGTCAATLTIPATVSDGGSTYNVTGIAATSFWDTAHPTSISIPASVTNIASSAFAYSKPLIDINVDATNPNYKSVGGILYNKVGTSLLAYPGGRVATTLTIPTGIIAIGPDAFSRNQHAVSVTLPVTTQTIGANAFEGAEALQNVVIYGPVPTIGAGAFTHILTLRSVSIPATVTEIGTGAFMDDAALDTVTIAGAGLRTIGMEAFRNCSSLTSLTLPSSVRTFGSSAFAGMTALTAFEVPEGVTSIDGTMFTGDADVRTLTLPSTLTSVGGDGPDSATYQLTGLERIDVADGSTTFSSVDGVLFNAARTTLVQYPQGSTNTTYAVPDGVRTIAPYALALAQLHEVTMPRSLTAIAGIGMSYMFNLETLTFDGNAPTTEGNSMSFTPLTVPVRYYDDTTGWSDSFLGHPTVRLHRPDPPATASSATGSGTATSGARLRLGKARVTRRGIVTTFYAPSPGSVEQAATATAAGRKASTLTACTLRKAIKRAGSVTLTCRFTKAARRALRATALRAVLTTTFTPERSASVSTQTPVALPRL